jgi:tetratricopeptide (TPR) repeat protein
LSVLGIADVSACTRKAIPGLSAVKAAKEYNQAAFNSFFVEGTKQKLMGNLGESLRYFEQCLSMNPESDATYYQMAQIMINNGDIGSGKKYINKAVVLQPENLWYQMTLAGVYYQQKNLDSAIICYEKAVKEYPEREGLQISLANLYTENQKYEKARGILNRFDEKYGVNDNTTVSLIRALMAEKKYGEARVKVDQLLVQNPDDVVFNGLLAEIYSGEGENGKAFDVYNRLFERNPGDPHIQLSLCDFLLTEKNYGELLNLMNTVLLNDRITRQEKVSLVASLIENKDIIKNYGPKMELVIMVLEAKNAEDDLVSLLRPDFLQKEGNLTGAATRLEEIIRSRPDNYYAWEKLLLVYYELKDYVTLENRGKECATRFNRSVLAKILYANGALENRNFEVALEELRKADILAGENKDIKLQVLTMKADVYYRMKNFPDAFKTFDEALKLNDNDNTVMNNYAYYLAEQDMKLKEAEEMAVKVIEKEPSNTTFLDTYAWVLYKRGKTREAAKIMEKILGSGETDDAEWYEHYGFILKKMGKCREAVEKWETALSLDKSKTNLQKEIENCKK